MLKADRDLMRTKRAQHVELVPRLFVPGVLDSKSLLAQGVWEAEAWLLSLGQQKELFKVRDRSKLSRLGRCIKGSTPRIPALPFLRVTCASVHARPMCVYVKAQVYVC